MSYRSKSTGQVISEEQFETLWSILEHYRYERKTTGKQQEAIVTILNDFGHVGGD
tara:strand:+ start:1486 stop:1650 length:165 start_codon:yes stop_codon:yes gene_type:complete